MSKWAVLVVTALEEIQQSMHEGPFDEPIGWVMLALFGVTVVAGPLLMVVGGKKLQQAFSVFTNEPVGAGEVHLEDGIVEVEGTAQRFEKTLTGKYSNETALAQSWKRERKQEREQDDGSTNTTWTTVNRGSNAVPFLVEDDTGAVVVDARSADLSISTSRIRRRRRLLPWRKSRKNRRYREYEGRIEPGDGVHVYGQVTSTAQETPPLTDDPAYIGDGDDVSNFLVSKGSELRTVLRLSLFGLLVFVVGAVFVPIGIVMFLLALEAVVGIGAGSWLIDLLS
ncbi:GIDE domain-containing protein [Natrarchaeobius chitinivorans]|uniref:RING-type E3 ubiquitin transferase n=1 Tax=Natrarchaeobius chitinivorans TaxID=1679083 RepID=A0A3N6PC24_NATCH|nr:GIDE domain-containing protein [Natrarchaeobius chitinivorans]RQG94215.1 hypothetical protein EA473_12635 [Natrarchaeobius chitinivorans]